MHFQDKTVVVTGGASGIGAALMSCFDAQGARTFSLDKVSSTEPECFSCDVSDAEALNATLSEIEAMAGSIDIYVSNAGVLSSKSDPLGDLDDWTQCWEVNVMAHVHAARAVIPGMVARRAGHFVIVASAAGLLNQIGDAPYSATKHAAVSFAESLAITYHGTGLGVSVVCPQYVATPLIELSRADARGSLLTADEVAQCVVLTMKENRFMVLPHPEVRDYALNRARNYDGWIAGMAKLRQRAIDEFGDVRPAEMYKLV